MLSGADAAERAARVGTVNDAKCFAERVDIDAGVPEYLRPGKNRPSRSGEFAENSGCDDAAESQAAGDANAPAGWSRGRRRFEKVVRESERRKTRLAATIDALRSFAELGLCEHLQPCAPCVDRWLGQPGNLRVR
jgi:hypothetical protein